MADDNLRQDMIDQVRAEQQARPKPARVHRAPAPARDKPAQGAEAGRAGDSAAGLDEGSAPVRKRRRRRRPGGAAGGGGAEGTQAGGSEG